MNIQNDNQRVAYLKIKHKVNTLKVRVKKVFEIGVMMKVKESISPQRTPKVPTGNNYTPAQKEESEES